MTEIELGPRSLRALIAACMVADTDEDAIRQADGLIASVDRAAKPERTFENAPPLEEMHRRIKERAAKPEATAPGNILLTDSTHIELLEQNFKLSAERDALKEELNGVCAVTYPALDTSGEKIADLTSLLNDKYDEITDLRAKLEAAEASALTNSVRAEAAEASLAAIDAAAAKLPEMPEHRVMAPYGTYVEDLAAYATLIHSIAATLRGRVFRMTATESKKWR